ncbi:MAG TPA: SRPBCC family protein [Frankiaceae bacterium]|jgi:uncharacterized protein YndB with AHSA1/START domain|nr:SRPBCC family protein [Frankiaceae bacterium]
MFDRKRRTFSHTTVVDASVEQVWDVVGDWKAMYWIVTGSVLALPVPDLPTGVGAVTCCWQRASDGAVRAGVCEVVEFEPLRAIVLLERQRPEANSRIGFDLEAASDGTRVQISVSECMYRYEWGRRGEGVTERFLRRLAEGLEVALANEAPGPHDVQTLVLQADSHSAQAVHEVQIEAPPDDIWPVVQQEEGALLVGPELEKQWFARQDGRDLQVQMIRTSDGGMSCAFQQILRPDPFRLVVRGPQIEIDHQVLPVTNASLLRLTHRWNPRAVSAQLVHESAERWLAAVKALAEGGVPPPAVPVDEAG